MSSRFDKIISREGTNAVKWDGREKVFGTSDVLPLWVADMDFASPPGVAQAVAERARHPIYGYPDKPDAFYEAASRWMKRRSGVNVKKEWMATVPGVVVGLHVAIDAFSDPGDEVIIQPPVYYPFFQAIKSRGRHIVENPLVETDNGYVMNLDDLKKKISRKTKILILCHPHNPVGRVWKEEELMEVARICREKEIVVISDEIHADLVYEKGDYQPFFSLPDRFGELSLTFISPSKTFNLAGLFTSIAFSPHSRIRRQFRNTLQKAALMHVNLFGIEAARTAYETGEAWLEELLVYLKGNAAFIRQFLQEERLEVTMNMPEGTYLGWLDFRRWGLPPERLRRLLIEKGKLGLDDGAKFGKQGEGFQRINFACPRSTLEVAMQRLKEAARFR